MEQSWAQTFYQEFFHCIEEDAFAVIYLFQISRPDEPIN